MENEKRKNKRLQVDGYSVQIKENNLLYAGIVENVSLTGLRVKFCPRNSSRNSKLLTDHTVAWDKKSSTHDAPEYRLVFSSDPFSSEPDAAPAESTGRNMHHNGNYILTARPCWRAKEDDITRIGFNITRYCEDWRQFVLQILPMRNLLRLGTLPGLPAQRRMPDPFAGVCDIHCPEKKYCREHGQAEIPLPPVHPVYKSVQVGLL